MEIGSPAARWDSILYLARWVFFGMIFFVIATTIEQILQTRAVLVYVGIAGLGINLLAILFASPVYHATYTTFGTASSSFVVFAL
jgi:hypothetical protein